MPTVFIPQEVALRPRIFADFLLVPLHPYHSDNWNGIICSQLHLGEKATLPIECFVKESDEPILEIFTVNDDKFLAMNRDSISLYLVSDKHPIWKISCESIYSFEFNGDYLITIGLVDGHLNGFVKIYNVSDSSLYKTIFVDTNIWVTSNVQVWIIWNEIYFMEESNTFFNLDFQWPASYHRLETFWSGNIDLWFGKWISHSKVWQERQFEKYWTLQVRK